MKAWWLGISLAGLVLASACSSGPATLPQTHPLAQESEALGEPAGKKVVPAVRCWSDRGCHETGMFYAKRKRPGDFLMAHAYFRKGCQRGHALACYNLALTWAEGLGVHIDLDAARTLYAYACEQKYGDGCNNLAMLYLHGVGVEVDEARALRLFLDGCRHGSGEACVSVGLRLKKGHLMPIDEVRAADCRSSRSPCLD